MKKLVACALLGLGLTQSLVACSDDDDDSGNTAGSAGTSAGSNTGGKNNGGSANGGNAGKNNGGSAGSGGTAGKGGSGGNGGKAGSTNIGGDDGGGAGGGGGDPAVGGDTSIGGEGGAGGAPGEPEPTQTPTAHWLSDYCDAKAIDTLGCTGSPTWHGCYNQLVYFISGEGGQIEQMVCENDTAEYEKTQALIAAMDALAAACPDTVTEDWTCNLSNQPEPKDEDCREANNVAMAASLACGTPTPP